MSDNTYKQLKDSVFGVIEDLENPGNLDPLEYGLDSDDEVSAWDYLGYQLGHEFKVDSELQYIGAEVIVGFGGPNIWIDTRHGQVHGAWGTDRIQFSYEDNIGLDDAMAQLYDSAQH